MSQIGSNIRRNGIRNEESTLSKEFLKEMRTGRTKEKHFATSSFYYMNVVEWPKKDIRR